MLSRLVVAAIMMAGAASANPLISVVHTDAGDVQGYTNAGVDIWRGIPFAAPPSGDNRFRRPQPVTPWSGVKETITQANICPQIRLADFLFFGNEDCLYLDVYSPSNREDPLPVFVWLFGGGYVLGDGYEFGFYDGQNLASKRDMIVVTPNYRLGPLGFLALDELASEDPSSLMGNLALHDQRAALEWVQPNIAAFGGDPSRVTVAGESAGAFSVCWHLAAPKSAGLFHAAILESGTCDAPEFFVAKEDSKSWSRTYSAMVGCDPNKLDSSELLPCLRKLETGVVMGHLLGHSTTPDVAVDVSQFTHHQKGTHKNRKHHQWSPEHKRWAHNMHELAELHSNSSGFTPLMYPVMSWAPTIDGEFEGLPDIPVNTIRAGKWNRVPVIMGTNENEGDIFVPILELVIKGLHSPLIDSDIVVAFDHFFNNNKSIVDSIVLEYPRYEYKSVSDDAAVVLRDYFFACAARRALTSMRESHPDQADQVWLYHFTYPGDFIEDLVLGDYHSAELPFVFDNPWPPLIHSFSQKDQEMADTFGLYWSNLVHFLTPNGNGLNTPQVFWPAYNASSLQNVILDVPAHVEDDLVKDKCDYWDRVVTGYPW